jgi:hypothetical protein
MADRVSGDVLWMDPVQIASCKVLWGIQRDSGAFDQNYQKFADVTQILRNNCIHHARKSRKSTVKLFSFRSQ